MVPNPQRYHRDDQEALPAALGEDRRVDRRGAGLGDRGNRRGEQYKRRRTRRGACASIGVRTADDYVDHNNNSCTGARAA